MYILDNKWKFALKYYSKRPAKKDRERFLPSPDLNFCCIPHCIIIFHCGRHEE